MKIADVIIFLVNLLFRPLINFNIFYGHNTMQFISVGGGVQSNDIILLQGYCYNEFLIGGCMVITFVVQYVSWMMNIAFDKL